jgi:signal transduction histidine kinase
VNKRLGTFDETDEAVLDTISDVATLAIMNSRMLDRSTKVAALEGMGRAAHDLANKAGVLVTFLPDFERNLNGLRAALATGEQNNEAKFYMEMLQGTYEDVFAPYSQRVYRYAKLVNDLAAGKELVPQRKFWNFAAVVREAAQYMESSARRSHVKLIYDLQLDAPEFAFDDLYVIRIVENLVGNAIKAVNETIPDSWLAENGGDVDATYGSVRIQYRLAGENHILVVSDDGPGMSPGTIRQILGGSAKSNWEQSTGSGLGTKVITELAMAHGAKLSIRSKLGEGSVFEVDFGTGEVPATMKSETLARSRQ